MNVDTFHSIVPLVLTVLSPPPTPSSISSTCTCGTVVILHPFLGCWGSLNAKNVKGPFCLAKKSMDVGSKINLFILPLLCNSEIGARQFNSLQLCSFVLHK